MHSHIKPRAQLHSPLASRHWLALLQIINPLHRISGWHLGGALSLYLMQDYRARVGWSDSFYIYDARAVANGERMRVASGLLTFVYKQYHPNHLVYTKTAVQPANEYHRETAKNYPKSVSKFVAEHTPIQVKPELLFS